MFDATVTSFDLFIVIISLALYFFRCRMPSVIICYQLFGYVCFCLFCWLQNAICHHLLPAIWLCLFLFVLLAAECHQSSSVTSYLVMFVFVCFVGCRMPSVIICNQLFGYVCFCLFCQLQNAICHYP